MSSLVLYDKYIGLFIVHWYVLILVSLKLSTLFIMITFSTFIGILIELQLKMTSLSKRSYINVH